MRKHKLIFKPSSYKEAEASDLRSTIDKYLKHYENIYTEFWEAEAGSAEDLKAIGAVYEARYLLTHIFGIEGETLDFIQFKVESGKFNHTTVKIHDIM